MYAHGYEMPAMKPDPKRFQSPSADLAVRPFLDRGFAVARSHHLKQVKRLTS